MIVVVVVVVVVVVMVVVVVSSLFAHCFLLLGEKVSHKERRSTGRQEKGSGGGKEKVGVGSIFCDRGNG